MTNQLIGSSIQCSRPNSAPTIQYENENFFFNDVLISFVIIGAEKVQASESFEMDSLQTVAVPTRRHHVISKGQSSKAQGLLSAIACYILILEWITFFFILH